MANASPFFSIIMPTHQRPLLLHRALQSVRMQTFQSFELIVVADALDAATAATCALMLRDDDVFVKRSGPPGPAESRNLGMTLARGKWVMFLDDDDAFQPTHLETAHRRITRPGTQGEAPAEVLFSDFDVVTENRSQDPILPLSQDRTVLRDKKPIDLYLRNFIPNNALVYQRPILEGCVTDPHLESLEDWDFLLAVCERSLPVWYEGGGAIVHKDFENPMMRRGSKTAALDSNVLMDVLHVFRRWRAPNPDIQAQRQALILSVGLNLPVSLY